MEKGTLIDALAPWPVTLTPNGCIEFGGSRNGDGYGQFWVKAIHRVVLAHRAMAVLSGKLEDFDDPALVCHTCDNPPCINDEHLYRGDKQSNMMDCIKRQGVRNHHSRKLYCSRGHPLFGLNLAVMPGRRICRICRAYRMDRWRAIHS